MARDLAQFSIELADLYIAYRKAKADLFYERDHVGILDFVRYELDLDTNLKRLYLLLTSHGSNWFEDPSVVGGYSYITKKIELPKPISARHEPQVGDGLVAVQSDPDREWSSRLTQAISNEPGGAFENGPKVSLRLVGNHPVDFRVIASLWLLKVGVKYDAILGDWAFGSRLRLTPESRSTKTPEMNEIATGSFKPYSPGFRAWRKNGLKAIRDALRNGHDVAAITGDLRQFYHRTSPNFLLDTGFLERTGIGLNDREIQFTQNFVAALNLWSSSTREHKATPGQGLPVGLSAARVIANCSLWQFDQAILQEVIPLYYGRYVDDIFLVLKNPGKWKTAMDVWNHVCQTTGVLRPLLSGKPDDSNQAETVFGLTLDGHNQSKLEFAGDKQKVFLLSGDEGESLLDVIERQANSRSSEWRMLPDLPEDSDDLVHDILCAGDDTTEDVDNLRKADGVRVRRLGFAIRMRNLEAAHRDLHPEHWEKHRKQFFKVARTQVLSLPKFFDYAPYVSRLIGLTVAVQDWQEGMKILLRAKELFSSIRGIPGFNDFEALEICRGHLFLKAYEATIQALPLQRKHIRDSVECAAFLEFLGRELPPADAGRFPTTIEKAVTLALHTYLSDLSRVPFREGFLEGRSETAGYSSQDVLGSAKCIDTNLDFTVRLELDNLIEFLSSSKLINFNDRGLPMGFVFPTRPFTVGEVTGAFQPVLNEPERLARWMRATRGIRCGGGVGSPEKWPEPPELAHVQISYRSSSNNRTIAVPCLLTKDMSWVASVVKGADPDAGDRYFRINRMVNRILKSYPKVDYIVFPELSLPKRWFNRLAYKLQQSGISLIGGIEYQHRDPANPVERAHAKSYVTNQVMASLITNFSGFDTAITVVQEKWRPAQHEEELLWSKGGVRLVPFESTENGPRKYLIHHGDFMFGMLVCSELTNIEFRQRYRGLVDALMVPEWNSDTETFSSIVEATAFDVHCFVVQVNNREFGDCRIRGPFKDHWRRDIARIKGGSEDYYVIGEIDFQELRRCQSAFRTPSSPFKPTPDGFLIDPRRRRLPKPD